MLLWKVRTKTLLYILFKILSKCSNQNTERGPRESPQLKTEITEELQIEIDSLDGKSLKQYCLQSRKLLVMVDEIF